MVLAMMYFTLPDLTDPAALLNSVGADFASITHALLIFIAAVIIAVVVRVFITRYATRLAARTATTLDDEIIRSFNGPVQAFIIVTGAYAALKVLNGLPAATYGIFDIAYGLAIIAIVAFQISRLAHVVIDWYRGEIGKEGVSKQDVSVLSFLKKTVDVIVFIAAALMALTRLHVEITPLLASLGIAGIAVALGAQEMLSNVFGAFAILADKPYKVGDRIELTTGEGGDVVDIGLRSTRIRTLDNRVVIVPNADISKSRISNYSMPDPRLRYTIRVGIAYGADVDRASALLEEIAGGVEGALKDPAPVVYIEELGDYSINLVMQVWGGDFRKDWGIPDRIYREVLKRFAGEGIVIPYPVTTVILPDRARGAVKAPASAVKDSEGLRYAGGDNAN